MPAMQPLDRVRMTKALLIALGGPFTGLPVPCSNRSPPPVLHWSALLKRTHGYFFLPKPVTRRSICSLPTSEPSAELLKVMVVSVAPKPRRPPDLVTFLHINDCLMQ